MRKWLGENMKKCFDIRYNFPQELVEITFSSGLPWTFSCLNFVMPLKPHRLKASLKCQESTALRDAVVKMESSAKYMMLPSPAWIVKSSLMHIQKHKATFYSTSLAKYIEIGFYYSQIQYSVCQKKSKCMHFTKILYIWEYTNQLQ